MLKKRKNYKLVLGIVVGIIGASSIVLASTYYGSALDLSYDNTDSGLSSDNVQDALDELYEIKSNPTCPDGLYCEKLKTTLAVGDYVSYTPGGAKFTPDSTKTNSTSNSEMDPSELNLWRVLSINDDGTVDIISEYVTSKNVYFKGKIGYLNFVGYLNELASKYETTGITVRSRHFGYNGQTEYLADSSIFTQTTPPWTSSTTNNNNEATGGGDTLYQTDYNLVKTVLGTIGAKKVGTTTAVFYWIASRYYSYSSSSTTWGFSVYSVNAAGTATVISSIYSYNSGFSESSPNRPLRPIVTLDSELQYEGLGTEWYPMEIKG